MFTARQASETCMHAMTGARGRSLYLALAISSAAFSVSHFAGAQEVDRRQQRPFALQNAAAEDIAPQLRETLNKMPGKPEVIVDVNRNRLLVKGDRNALEAAAELIDALDVIEDTEQDPASKPVARGYKVEARLLDSTLKSLRELYKNQPGVSINSDKRTSKIVVWGPPEVQAEVSKAISASQGEKPQTDEPKIASPRAMAISTAPRRAQQLPSQQRLEAIHRFQNLSWEDFEDALRQIWGSQVEVTPDEDREAAEVRLVTRDGETHFLRIDRRRNQIEAAQPEPVANWKHIARVLDGLETKAGQEAQLLSVANARPVHVKEVVHALQSTSPVGKKTFARQALRRDAKTATWGGDLVSRVFEQEPGAQKPAEEKPADAPATEQDPAMEEEFDDFSNISPDVRIEYIEGLDIIVITGPPKDVERVKKLIEMLDRDTPKTEPDVQIVQLQHTNNEVLAPLLTQINDQVLVNRQGRVTIIPLGKPNAILLIGQKESVSVLESYIKRLDVEIPATDEYRVFRLKFIPAADAETAIRNFFTNNPGQGGAQQNQPQGQANTNVRPGLGTRPRIISEQRSNSLIVQGGAGDLRAVEALLKDIDVEDSPSVAEVRIFPLKTSLATDLAPILQAAISGQSSQATGQGNQQGNQGNQGANGAGANSARSASLQFMQVNKDGTKTIDSGIPTNVVIEAEPASNSLVVRGPARTMDLVAHLINQLDGVAKVGASIKVFQMQHADAQQVLTNLQTLFGVTNQAAGAQQQGAALTSPTSEGESPLVRLRFGVDRRSNSLIVAGNQGDLNIIEALLNNIDLKDSRNRKLYVYRLVNNDAQFVATAVQTLITAQQTQIRQQVQTAFLRGSQELLDSEVFIQPELVTNSVIISATPAKLAEVIRVIQHLDLRQPMVMVQMLIAEVSLENINELGAELGLQDSILFDRGLQGAAAGVPGFAFNNSPLGNTGQAANDAINRQIIAPQSLSSFGLGRTSASRGYGGLVLSASSESVSVLIRALQERNRLQILSRPEVMTVDRIPAQVLVGQNVPLVGATNVTVNTTTANVNRTNVGISLLVTPQVNADGQILIEVDATRSALGALQDGIPIPSGTGTVLQPIINVTQAVSTLSCRSGQTVIMAGLITKNDQKSAKGIPGLMEIPIVGRLFQFNSESSKRTELLMIMTPHIIWDGEDLNWLKQTETERMSWCLADVVEMNGDHGFSPGYGKWGSMNMNRIFPHTQPRGVEQCVGPPGPAPYFEKCPPEKYQPNADAFGLAPPSEIENRSNWGPPQSPLTLLRHPEDQPQNGEEIAPPAPNPESDPPADPLRNGGESLSPPIQNPPQGVAPDEESSEEPEATTSLRSVLKARNASTRRGAVAPEPKESEQPSSSTNASRRPSPPRGARGPASRETLPANYESRSGASRTREVDPAGYSNEGTARKPSKSSAARRPESWQP